MGEGYKKHDEVIKTTLTELVLLLHFGFVLAGGALVGKIKTLEDALGNAMGKAKTEPGDTGKAEPGDKGQEQTRNPPPPPVLVIPEKSHWGLNCLAQDIKPKRPFFLGFTAHDGRYFVRQYRKGRPSFPAALQRQLDQMGVDRLPASRQEAARLAGKALDLESLRELVRAVRVAGSAEAPPCDYELYVDERAFAASDPTLGVKNALQSYFP